MLNHAYLISVLAFSRGLPMFAYFSFISLGYGFEGLHELAALGAFSLLLGLRWGFQNVLATRNAETLLTFDDGIHGTCVTVCVIR